MTTNVFMRCCSAHVKVVRDMGNGQEQNVMLSTKLGPQLPRQLLKRRVKLSCVFSVPMRRLHVDGINVTLEDKLVYHFFSFLRSCSALRCHPAAAAAVVLLAFVCVSCL